MKRTLRESVRHAMNGFVLAFRSQQNLRIHSIIALIVLIAAFMLGISRGELIILVVMIALVFSAEFLNTALEMLSDILNPRVSAQVGRLKDVSAAGVLTVSFAALAVGLLIFIPYIF